MAREEVEYPAGVSQSVFETHTHNYRKITKLGVDADSGYSSPVEVNIIDDTLVHANEFKAETVGIEVATLPTGAPN